MDNQEHQVCLSLFFPSCSNANYSNLWASQIKSIILSSKHEIRFLISESCSGNSLAVYQISRAEGWVIQSLVVDPCVLEKSYLLEWPTASTKVVFIHLFISQIEYLHSLETSQPFPTCCLVQVQF